MSKTAEIKERLIKNLSNSYYWLTKQELEETFNCALADYMFLKYPSANYRPSVEKLDIDFMVEQWLIARCKDILSRGGGISASAYAENGVNITYGASYIDPTLAAMIKPEAVVPR